MNVHSRVAEVTERIVERSRPSRGAYLARVEAARGQGPRRGAMACGNLAHTTAGCGAADKADMASSNRPNIGIVTAYNDMLSAHRPYEDYPKRIRAFAREFGGTAQVAGGVPAMCDGITQGRAGMELSLFSRDVIALATGVALSHDAFDAAVCLGICDKIVPGLVIGAATFGHLPFVFIPGGPMPTGISNREKNRVRQAHAAGEVSREQLLEAEMASYHAPGTCTFYGTANSNQMMMESMGLHIPGASFENPGTPLREALTREGVRRALAITALGDSYTPIAHVLDEKAFVNGIVTLHATGGSTNLTIHLIAMARAAGVLLDWEDFSDLSDVTPLLARVYPNGDADVNGFRDAGGTTFVIGELLDAGLLHRDINTVNGTGLEAYARPVTLDSLGRLQWGEPTQRRSGDETILRPAKDPFQMHSGLQRLCGNLGTGVIKISSVKPELHLVEAPARVFANQDEVIAAFMAGDLDRDCICVVRFQGPKANGMPELHSLTPSLGVLIDRGFRVALVTDGRMSGASGKVPAAIHLSPEAVDGGPIARVRDGDLLRLDAAAGTLEALVDRAEWEAREPAAAELATHGCGRELFANFRQRVGSAEAGASVLF